MNATGCVTRGNGMGIGDLTEIDHGDCRDLYCLDTGLYGTPSYGAIYVFDTDRPAIVETSTGRNHGLLLDALDTLGIALESVETIALTHVHLDHAGGAGRLVADCPNATVHVHDMGAGYLVEPGPLVAGVKPVVGELWDFHVEPTPIAAERITAVGDGDVIDLGDRRLDVIRVPGHATHQVAFHEPSSGVLFAADAAGMWLPDHDLLTVTTPPTSFDLEQNLDDLDRLDRLGAETILYTHFGARDSGTALADYRALLTEWVEAVRTARREHADRTVIERLVSESPLAAALGHPAGTVPAEMFVKGVFEYLDRAD